MRIGGLASGMDIDSLVKDLMTAERIPLDKLFQKRQTTEWQRDAYREINLSLSKFRDAFSKLRLQSSFNGYGVSSTNTNVITASATASATLGTYSITDIVLVEAAKLESNKIITKNNDGTTKAKSSDLVLSGGTENFTITNGNGLSAEITVTSTDTFGSLATKIANAKDKDSGESLGLRANFDDATGRFFIASKEMGQSQSITFQNVSSPSFVEDYILGTGNLSDNGVDGSLKFNGYLVDSLTTNKVTVNGINLELNNSYNGADPITINVKSDTESIFNSIKDFVEKYNELIDNIQSKLDEPKYRDYAPLTNEQREALSDKEVELWDEKSKSGLLRNDPFLRTTLFDLRRAMYDPVQGISTNELNQISQIGITTGDYRSGGKLSINEDKLKEALSTRPDEVMNLFTKAEEESGNIAQMGIGSRIYKELNHSLDNLQAKAGIPGLTSGDRSTLGKNILQLNDQIGRWEDKLAQIENRYWRQFSAMEKAINQMNQQSMWMTQNMFGGQQ